MTFESPEARDNYLPHPKHREFGKFLGELDILEDAFVIDYIPEERNRNQRSSAQLVGFLKDPSAVQKVLKPAYMTEDFLHPLKSLPS